MRSHSDRCITLVLGSSNESNGRAIQDRGRLVDRGLSVGSFADEDAQRGMPEHQSEAAVPRKRAIWRIDDATSGGGGACRDAYRMRNIAGRGCRRLCREPGRPRHRQECSHSRRRNRWRGAGPCVDRRLSAGAAHSNSGHERRQSPRSEHVARFHDWRSGDALTIGLRGLQLGSSWWQRSTDRWKQDHEGGCLGTERAWRLYYSAAASRLFTCAFRRGIRRWRSIFTVRGL